MTIQSTLDFSINAVCPIYGISFVDITDKTTWKVNFKPEATQAEKDAAQAIIDNYDFLDNYKEQAIAANKTIGGTKISALFNSTYGTDELRDRQFNCLMQYNELREKEIAATITEIEQTIIDTLRLKKDNIDLIRKAENDAAALINVAVDNAAVDAVSATWP